MSMLGSLPLLPAENPADHERLRTTVTNAMMMPTDLMEMIWTNDIKWADSILWSPFGPARGRGSAYRRGCRMAWKRVIPRPTITHRAQP
jgi:hypothetical protein